MAIVPTILATHYENIIKECDRQIAAETLVSNDSSETAQRISEATERIAVYTAQRTHALGAYSL